MLDYILVIGVSSAKIAAKETGFNLCDEDFCLVAQVEKGFQSSGEFGAEQGW